MGKGEIARYEQFLLFPQCFQKACYPGASKGVIVWEWVNTHINSSPNDKSLGLSKLKAFADKKIIVAENLKLVYGRLENIVVKGGNADYQHFLLFPQCFSTYTVIISIMEQYSILILSSANALDLAKSNPLYGKELTPYQMTKFQTGPN